VHDKQKVPSPCLLDFRRLQTPLEVGVANRFDLTGFEADVHKAARLRVRSTRIQLYELAIIDFDKRNRSFAGIREFEGLFEPQAVVEIAGLREIADPKRHVSDPRQARRLGAQRWRAEQHKDQDADFLRSARKILYQGHRKS
jgi:hypothetical protein